MIKRIRKGNNISVNWVVYKNQNSQDLSEDSLQLYLVDALKKKTEITDFTVSGNVISFIFYGKNQCHLNSGKFSLLLIANRCTNEQFVLDKQDVFILLDKLDGQVETGNGPDNISIETINIISEATTGNVAVDLSRYYTKDEVNEIVDGIIAGEEQLKGYVSYTYLISKDYVSKDELFSYDYASKPYVTQQIVKTLTSGEVSLEGYVSKEDLNNSSYATQSYVMEKINSIPETDLTGYATESYVSERIQEAIPQVSDIVTYQALESYNFITGEYLSSIGYLTEHQDLSYYVQESELRNNYYNREQVNEIISDYVQVTFEEEDKIFKASPAYTISNTDINNWNSKSEFSGSYIDLTDKPDFDKRYVSYTYLENKDYVDKTYLAMKLEDINVDVNIDLSSYATKTDLNSLATKQELQDYTLKNELSSYATKTDLNSLATKQELQTAISSVVVNETDPLYRASASYNITFNGVEAANHLQYVNATGKLMFDSGVNSNDGVIATEEYVIEQLDQIDNNIIRLTQEQYDFLQENNLISPYKMYLITDTGSSAVMPEDLTPYATKVYVGNQLDGYYTKAQVDALIATVTTGGVIDLSGYAEYTWVRDYISSLNLASKQDLNTEKNNILTLAYNYADKIDAEGVDLTNYATKAYVNNQLQNYATLSDIPSISGLASRVWVENNFMDKSEIDLTPYVTKSYTEQYYAKKTDLPENWVSYTYLDNKIQEIVITGAGIDLSSYATKAELNDYMLKNQATGFATKNDLSSYLTKTDAGDIYQLKGDYATKTYVDNYYQKKSSMGDYLTGDSLNTYLSSYATKQYVDNEMGYIVWTGYQTDYDSLQDKTKYKIYLIQQS